MSMKKRMSIALAAAALFSFSTVYAQEPVWDANKVDLVSEKLADGVFAYYPSDAKELQKLGKPVATSGGFVIGDKGVLIIDTMLNQRLNAQIQKMVQKKAGKSIIFAVNTSFHGDHSYGNMYLPEATTIIQHSNAKQYIDRHFKADTEFMIQNFGSGRGIEKIIPVTGDILVAEGGKITVDLGGKSVDIIDFGYAQTGGDLFVWEPESKVLWSGNPIITVKPSLPWLLDGHLVETLESLKKVYEFLPKTARVVPGHGSVIAREDIKMAYRLSRNCQKPGAGGDQ